MKKNDKNSRKDNENNSYFKLPNILRYLPLYCKVPTLVLCQIQVISLQW